MKPIGKTKKLIELFETDYFEIIVEFKEEDKRIVNYELRQKNSANSPYKGYIAQTFENLDSAREYFYKVLQANFILQVIQ